MNKDQVKGKARAAKGKVKETVGEMTGNRTLKYRGKAEKIAGKTQARFGNNKYSGE